MPKLFDSLSSDTRADRSGFRTTYTRWQEIALPIFSIEHSQIEFARMKINILYKKPYMLSVVTQQMVPRPQITGLEAFAKDIAFREKTLKEALAILTDLDSTTLPNINDFQYAADFYQLKAQQLGNRMGPALDALKAVSIDPAYLVTPVRIAQQQLVQAKTNPDLQVNFQQVRELAEKILAGSKDKIEGLDINDKSIQSALNTLAHAGIEGTQAIEDMVRKKVDLKKLHSVRDQVTLTLEQLQQKADSTFRPIPTTRDHVALYASLGLVETFVDDISKATQAFTALGTHLTSLGYVDDEANGYLVPILRHLQFIGDTVQQTSKEALSYR